MQPSHRVLLALVASFMVGLRSVACFSQGGLTTNLVAGKCSTGTLPRCGQHTVYKHANPLRCRSRLLFWQNLVCTEESGLERRGGKSLHVYAFVTMVGWGKNTLLNELSSLDATSCKEHFGSSIPPVILESDEIGKDKFWPVVEKTIKDGDDDLDHLILNKNFPPNSWKGTVKRLKRVCEEKQRNLCIHAIFPKSVGSERNAFSLFDCATCLYSVKNRQEHPNLSSSANNIPEVVSLFYKLYHVPGGRKEFLNNLRNNFTESVIEVDWIKSECMVSTSQDLDRKMEKLFWVTRKINRAKKENQNEIPDDLRSELDAVVVDIFDSQTNIQMFETCRLEPSRVLQSFLENLPRST
ncbi:hypothetical protein GUITHDRAFT_114554 [Guillardia theta CCMP2712]|uniref:Uncharacterized protein n=1 Tax=Guillardia theta (strain CCMP2712) TaxID=905079 RepID=L1ITE4_GUITC|nr:hypothetical protein GUITHDRAFT_114554 [Guillardia theta CCMP2712]EKX39357.1 hypothetical protein GUITHDRAFT_114554 [Guillardia theta CCMP2712]|eukprot:XP_005826337.1 hypothetical protein GUITHDRAFT_114554 [Guillardia theta CCMP2712]